MVNIHTRGISIKIVLIGKKERKKETVLLHDPYLPVSVVGVQSSAVDAADAAWTAGAVAVTTSAAVDAWQGADLVGCLVVVPTVS